MQIAAPPVPAERLAAHRVVATALAVKSDAELAELLAGGRSQGAGIGGSAVALEVAGVTVFAKSIPLTDLELRSENHRSTADLFGLPTFYQYPMGSTGFSAWRELAAHIMTATWVLTGGFPGFPLTHHWRVLPAPPPREDAIAGEFGGIDGAVARWDGSAAVRRRLEAIVASRACIVVFQEHIPHRLTDWLAGPEADFALAERQLVAGAAFMRAQGFVHFDTHFGNVLTDGAQVYFADFGLATCDHFALSEAERRFLAEHRDFDLAYIATGLVAHAVDALREDRPRREFLRAWVAGSVERPVAAPHLAALLDRYGLLVLLVLDFHDALNSGPKTHPWPAEQVARLLSAVDIASDAASDTASDTAALNSR
ncbi:hypothetical protein [Actinocrinis sp.]|uniref:hypothetical protein n=1 Tax=Actinocrinis sp. TaxID=1920516 RepID=UPI002D5951A9|nr:hypothetical protein [Actinocrinis sp.]HZP52972.1 hypothetical protein [Actinocrinis sp.]